MFTSDYRGGGQVEGDNLDHWRTGLIAVGWLERYFPDFFAEHVAHRPISLVMLARVAAAFLSLADRELVSLRSHWGSDWANIDSVAALSCGPETDDDAIGMFEEEMEWGLMSPHPEMYGMGSNAHEMDEIERRLCVAVWWMVQETAWAIYDPTNFPKLFTSLEQMARGYDRVESERRWSGIVQRLPVLANETPMARLCDSLDADPPLGIELLGSTIRYILHQAGNMVLDVSNSEIEEQYGGFDFDWDMEDEIALYREGQELGRVYYRRLRELAKRLDTEPKLYGQLAKAILDRAEQLINEPRPTLYDLAVKELEHERETTDSASARPSSAFGHVSIR